MKGVTQDSCNKAAGYQPWLDREHIHPGQRWEPIIKSALKRSHFVLVCLSATSINKRGFLQKEIKQALEQAEEKLEDDVWLIPARLDDCDVPDALADIQWVDLFEEDGFRHLLAAMEYQLRKENIAPPSAEAKPKQVQTPISPPKLKPEPSQPVPEAKPAQEKPDSPLTKLPEPEQKAPPLRPEQIQQTLSSAPNKLPESKQEVIPSSLREVELPAPSITTPIWKKPVFRLSSKVRLGIAGVILATGAWLGYGVWTDSNRGNHPDNKSNPPIQRTNDLIEDLANGVKIEMVKLSGGEFTMGSNGGESDEKPQHQVKLNPFAIGKYEVTQGQWKAVMNDNPSYFHWADDLPVENVSWNMVQDFLRRLNGKFRLPTEAEWEYAARAGSQTSYSFGDDAGQLHNYAWFWDNSDFAMQAKQTHPVGQLKPNQFGLYDMHGNVWEWCSDWYSSSYYAECQKQGTIADPQGPNGGTNRVIRGGGWNDIAVNCRSADRYSIAPGNRYDFLGFRLVRIGR